MDTEVEKMDKRRMRGLEIYLWGFVIFLILFLTRYFFRQSGMNDGPIGTVVLVGLMLSLVAMILSTIASLRLYKQIKHDPFVESALADEFVQMLQVQSWKAAFIGAAAAAVFFAAVWFFYPVCDPVMIALTIILTGAGAYQVVFYLKYRKA
jgi:hypothetical protein